MKYILFFCICGTVYLLMQERLKSEYLRGKAEALKTNPVSEDLEMVCAGLWVGQQNRKYWEKENKK